MKKIKWLMSAIMILPFMLSACSDKDEENPIDNPDSIVGKWQKIGIVAPDGSVSGGDPDEFWIFEENGTFKNEDGGELTAIGNYDIRQNELTITSQEPWEGGEEENFTGTFTISNGYMDYYYTEIGENDYTTCRFKKQL